jgi:hypothetical protein
LRDLVDDGTDRQDVEIDEKDVVAGTEVFVANIAAADYRRLVVGGEGLVVHPPIEASEVEDVSEGSPAPHCERIEEAHLDVGLRVECGERFVQPARVVVVEQQPHADAASRGSTKCIEQEFAREVGLPDVVLHVEAALGGIGEPHPGCECIAPAEQWNDAR